MANRKFIFTQNKVPEDFSLLDVDRKVFKLFFFFAC